MRVTLVVSAALAALAAPLAAQQQLEVTLDEAVRRALQVQPAMVQARGESRTSGAAYLSAVGAFLPNLTTGASAIRNNQPFRIQGDTTTYPPVYTYSGTFSVSINRFDLVRRMGDLRASSAERTAAAIGVVNQRFQVTLATKQAFYNAIATEELVRVAESQVRRTEQQLTISIDKLRAGSATRSDSLRSTVDYGNARIGLLRARANLATAQASLGRQIGADRLVRAVPDNLLPPPPDTAAIRDAAVDATPQVQQAEALARAARANVWVARSEFWPSLDASYSNTRSGIGDPQLPLFGGYPERFQWRFGLSWTLFDGFQREQQQVSASVARDNAETRAAHAHRDVSAQLTQQLAAITTSFEQIDIARATVAAATEDLRVQSERYRVGASTILDLLTSQATLTQAEVSLVQARFDYLIARAELEALLGREL